jgi:hypothetical protein
MFLSWKVYCVDLINWEDDHKQWVNKDGLREQTVINTRVHGDKPKELPAPFSDIPVSWS